MPGGGRGRARAVLPPLTALVTALVTALALGGCGGQVADRAVEFGGGDPPNPTATTTPDRPCQARVALTGAVQETWSGPAQTAATLYAGPPSVYIASHGGTEVRLFSPGPNNAPSVQVSDGTRSWGISPPQAGTIHADGSGARVQATLVRTGVGGHDLDLQATFSC